ncbi:enoyl-CoA hydratase [Bradyrhizobium macuxiense]|uniref:Enoyl-CoA hydratase n=1 Tax=Bradyrhizobium macuxiense TaxID=1755647 RepID=A0A109JBL6_9BRAD|nr:crotonase/enoyl-CoA hydratase family protein [Bradyrhizobium macuxiense]KWV45868.1 enoyl-CoA hydratase [Bradyrhizobium macuxiense]
MDDRIDLSIANGIADVRLNRPDKLNALDPAMFSAIADTGARLRDDRRVGAVVLSGEGKAFCAGLDIERLVATTEGESILPFADLGQRTHGIANWAQHLVWLWRELPVPVIAAVHGVAFGGGFQLALGADIRYLAPDTRLSIVEAKWGLVPDMAGTQLMRHLAGEDVVRELTYTARIFSAREALTYGLATRIVDDPREAAFATARMIAGRSPDAIRAAKRLLNLAATCDAATGLAAETAAQAALLGTPNHVEAVRANLEHRLPQWSFA